MEKRSLGRKPRWLSRETWAELKALHPYRLDDLAEIIRYKPTPEEIRATAKRMKRELETSIYRIRPE